MILAIDIGNTTIALGGMRDGELCFVVHVETMRDATIAHYRAELARVFAKRRNPEKPLRFHGIVLSSVVPELTKTIEICAQEYTKHKPLIISPNIRTGLTMGVKNPEAVGKDRLADAAYAAEKFPLPVVTVDLGTATTFNVIDENRVFCGGAICPGVTTGLRALGERCSQLPRARLATPTAAIGTDTTESMLSGSIIGAAALIDGMVTRFEQELGKPCSLVVTGGLAKYVLPHCHHKLEYDAQLMMKGLAFIYELNCKK